MTDCHYRRQADGLQCIRGADHDGAHWMPDGTTARDSRRKRHVCRGCGLRRSCKKFGLCRDCHASKPAARARRSERDVVEESKEMARAREGREALRALDAMVRRQRWVEEWRRQCTISRSLSS